MYTKFLTHLLVVATVVGITISIAPSIQAAVTPTFPSCLNVQGTLKASYSNGVHGIVGKPGVEYRGQDAVYTLTDDTLMQCFCPENGQGIQTNWWKAASLNDQQVQSYIYAGWHYVSNGAAWGLEDDPYLAKNSEYSCLSGKGGGSNGGGGSSSGGSGGSTGGSSTSTSTIGSILGLASTGNKAFMYGLVSLGLILLFAGIVAEKMIVKAKK